MKLKIQQQNFIGPTKHFVSCISKKLFCYDNQIFVGTTKLFSQCKITIGYIKLKFKKHLKNEILMNFIYWHTESLHGITQYYIRLHGIAENYKQTHKITR